MVLCIPVRGGAGKNAFGSQKKTLVRINPFCSHTSLGYELVSRATTWVNKWYELVSRATTWEPTSCEGHDVGTSSYEASYPPKVGGVELSDILRPLLGSHLRLESSKRGRYTKRSLLNCRFGHVNYEANKDTLH